MGDSDPSEGRTGGHLDRGIDGGYQGAEEEAGMKAHPRGSALGTLAKGSHS